MANTFTLIASSTVGVLGSANIDFTSIPSTYTDLCLKLSMRDSATGAQDGAFISLNGSTANFTQKQIQGAGSGTPASFSVGRLAGYSNGSVGSTANTFSNVEWYFPNYASSNYKPISTESAQENNQTTAYILVGAFLWSNTAAINQITVTPDGGFSFTQYTTAYLYGIKNS
jgi:hypothetical protein